MTGIIKTDQLQGAQSSTITIPSGNNLTVGGAFTSQGIDDNANAVAITIDTSENVLVKKTASNYQSVGVEAKSTGQLWATADGNNPILAVRKSSDGKIQAFYKDTTEVGSIGVADGGDRIYLANGGAEGIGIDNGSNAFVPTNGSGAYADNHISLGRSDARWAGIYTSDGLFVGGTGSANQLDDYEEGTWTPVVRDASSGGNTGSYSSGGSSGNRYIKIGRFVYLTFELYNINTSGMTSGNTLFITGVPFSGHSSGTYNIGSCYVPRITVSGYEQAVIFMDQNPWLRIFCTDLDGNGGAGVEVGNVTSGQGDIVGTITYFSA